MPFATRSLAIVTGASSGIGYELAKCCAAHGFDLVIAADEPEIEAAAQTFRDLGAMVLPVQADLGSIEGVDKLLAEVQASGQQVEMLLANAGRGLGGAFLNQDFAAIRHVLDTNLLGTLYLIHKIGNDMRHRGRGRILITGSIAGFMPGSFQAVFNGSKAFLDSFSFALRNELQDSGVTVTCLMPGESEKADPAEVAQKGFEAMMLGDAEVIPGWQNKLRAAMAQLVPAQAAATMHRHQAEPKHPH